MRHSERQRKSGHDATRASAVLRICFARASERSPQAVPRCSERANCSRAPSPKYNSSATVRRTSSAFVSAASFAPNSSALREASDPSTAARIRFITASFVRVEIFFPPLASCGVDLCQAIPDGAMPAFFDGISARWSKIYCEVWREELLRLELARKINSTQRASQSRSPFFGRAHCGQAWRKDRTRGSRDVRLLVQ